MKIETTPLEDHQIKLNVEIEPETLEGSKRKAAKKIAKKIKVPGFRPGKAPYSVVQRQVGDGAILEEALDILLQDIYPSIIEEAEIDPYGPGALQNIVTMEPPTFEFLIPLSPEVKLSEYREVRVDVEPKKVADEDIQKVLDNLREGQAIIEPSDKVADQGDMVYILISGEREAPKDGEEKSLVEERKLPVVIEKEDSDTTGEWPFPGFSRNLIGMKAGDEKEIKHKFDKEYEYEDLRGVKAVYQVKVDEVKARILPELDDEFAKSLGEYDNMEDVRKDIQENLEMRYEQEYLGELDDKIIEEILPDTEIKFPPQMLEDELSSMLSELNSRLESQGLNMDIYLKSRELENDEQLREELKPSAEDRLKRALILMEIAKQEEIQINPEDVNRQIQGTIAQINQYYPEADARRLTSGESLNNIINRITSDNMIENTLIRLRKIAKGEPIEDESDKAEDPTSKESEEGIKAEDSAPASDNDAEETETKEEGE